jgi:hypothetical protein
LTAPYQLVLETLEVPISRVRSLAVLSAVVALTGCSSYRLVPLSNIAPNDQVRVTVRDGHRVELQAVTVAADTLRGLRQRQGHPGSVTIAVANLTKVEVLRMDAGRSVGLVVGTAAVIFLYMKSAVGGPVS